MAARWRIGAVLGSIRTRLAVFFFLITAIAIAVVYIYVTPSLQSYLESQQLTDTHNLARSVPSNSAAKNLAALARTILYDQVKLSDAHTELQNLKNPKPKARLTPTQLKAKLKDAQAAYAKRAQVLTNSTQQATKTLNQLAQRTGANTVTPLQFSLSSNGSPHATALLPPGPTQRVVNAGTAAFTAHAADLQAVNSGLGIVAVPVPGKKSNSVFVYTVTFADVSSDVALIRHRILIAALIALAVVLLL